MKKLLFRYTPIVLLMFLCVGCWDKGNGEKIGTIVKLNQQGFFFKTWEAEIVRGGLNGGSGVMGQSFHFTIEDQSLVDKVKQALESQQEVKIRYHMEAVTWCRSDSEDHFLTSIEPVVAVTTPPMQQSQLGINGSDQAAVLQILKRQQELNEENQKLLQALLQRNTAGKR